MGIFLSILLYAFLGIIGLCLLILLLAVVAPFRLACTGRTRERPLLTLEFSWLSPRIFHILYDSHMGRTQIRLFGSIRSDRSREPSDSESGGPDGLSYVPDTKGEFTDEPSLEQEGLPAQERNEFSEQSSNRQDEIADQSSDDRDTHDDREENDTSDEDRSQSDAGPFAGSDDEDVLYKRPGDFSDEEEKPGFHKTENPPKKDSPDFEPYQVTDTAQADFGNNAGYRDKRKEGLHEKEQKPSIFERWRYSNARFFLREKKLRNKLLKLLGRFLKALFRIIRLEHFRVYVRGGANDPSVTGKAFGYIRAAQGFLACKNKTYHLDATPVFGEGLVFQAKGEVSIQSSVLRLLYPVLCILFTFPYLNVLLVYLRFRRLKRVKKKMGM